MFQNFKLLKVIFIWATFALSVSTVVLALQHVQLNADVKDAREKLDFMESWLEGEIKPRFQRSAEAGDEEIDYRLPRSMKPMHYDLYLHPDMVTGTFSGQEIINVSVLEVTKQMILHSHKLEISNVYVMSSNDDNLAVQSYFLDERRQFLVINMEEAFIAGSHVKLGIMFSGKMSGNIVGLYTSTYIGSDGGKRTIATSKFEPTYARQAFPCFDEPNMKARFRITLVRPTGDGYHALSNMNEESSTHLSQGTEVIFAESVPMSTYLACVIVSDFASKSKPVHAEHGDDFDIRIFATSHQLNKTDFALDTAVAVTEFYIKNFKVPYPLPKLDMAAIPDFASNAMEHWGLVTYRETALLYDRSFSSTWNKQRIAAVIAHELAHMWFGNLVTMNWWNDLWLNEGFARFMEYKGINQIYKQWGLPDQFLIHALHGVMKYDASVASHPIIQIVENPDQITEIFDTISYEKGASVIRMLEDVVGIDKFEQAVTNYLTKFKFQNAVTSDFLTEVEKTGLDFDVKLMMRTWTEQMGFPVINVKKTSPTTYELTQKRFFSNIDDYDLEHNDSEFNYKWNIPLTYIYDHDATVQRKWLNYDTENVIITVPLETKWLKFNSHQVGFYRVNYQDEMWHAIVADLVATPEKFDIADRAHLLNDAFSLADASQISYSIALDMTTYLEARERDFVPWYVAATKLQALQASLVQTEVYVDYLKYARGLLHQIYKELTWTVDKDNHLRNRLRVSVLTAACSLGLPDCLNEASERFLTYLANPSSKPDPDLSEIVYYYGMQHVGKQEQWERMWQLFAAEQDASQKSKLMYGLAAVRIPWLLKRYIDLAANESYVRRQDYFNCIQYIAANPVGEPIVWEFVRENWPALVDRFDLNDRYLGRMIPAITEGFSTETKLDEMNEFFAKYPNAGAGAASRRQATENVKYKINWLKTNLADIIAWLGKH